MADPGVSTEPCYGSKADCIADLHADEPASMCHPVSELWMYSEHFDSWKPEDPPLRHYYRTKSKCDSRMEEEARGVHNAGTHAAISECHHVP
jgi:hypothetical protein